MGRSYQSRQVNIYRHRLCFGLKTGDKTAGHLGGMVERMQVATKTGADRISQFQDEWKRVGVRLHFPPSKIKLLKKKNQSVCLSPAKLDEGWGESEEARDGTMGKRQNSK